MKFRTEIDLLNSNLHIELDSKIMFLGSCFSTNIGDRFSLNGFNTIINPFGAIYNPLSIANNIEVLLAKELQTSEDLFKHNELFNNFKFHSSYSDMNHTLALDNMNRSITESHKFLNQANFLFITFGTSYIFEFNNQVVSNCHKLPSSMFKRTKADLLKMIEVWEKLLRKLHSLNDSVQIVFTVSPIRHLSDGLHQNQISKSQLFLLIDELNNKFSFTSYFPAYELVMDDLRDYRYYEKDMVHPNSLAIDYLWEKINTYYFRDNTKVVLEKIQNIQKSIDHKPFNIRSNNYKLFLENSLRELNILSQKYPYLRVEDKRNQLSSRLENFLE